MAAPTMQSPAALPQFGSTGKKLPAGAVKMSRAYLDTKNMPQKSLLPVPVDADERRTPHERFQCPHMKVINGGGKERCGTAEWLLPSDPAMFCPVHGKQLEQPHSGPSQLELVARDAVRLHGRSALPWAIPVGAAVADVAMSLAGVGTLDAGMSVPVLAAGAYVVTKRTLTRRAIQRRRIEKGQRDGKRVAAIARQAKTNAALAVEAGLWGSALAGTDLTHWSGLIVAAAGMARWGFGMHKWWASAEERRTRGQVEVVAPEPVLAAGPDPVQLRAVTTWKTLIGCANGPLAGTELTEFSRLPACEVNVASRTVEPNWAAKVVATAAGAVNMRARREDLLGRIAAAYQCTYADVSFTADEGDLSVGWLRVQPDNVLAETKLWADPSASDWKSGESRIGRFDDGRPIRYQWWTDLGAAHDLIGGCSGSGKSELITQLLLASLHSNGLVLDWVGDPQGGQSFGVLKDAVDWFARDKAEITLMLIAAVKEMYRRNDELARRNIKTWRPTTDMPLLVITLDEVQDYLDDSGPVYELVTKIAGMGRKCGIKLRLSTQIIAAYNLGGSTYIKEQVKSGQTLTFRSETDVASRSAVEGDSPIDPTALPRRWGPKTCAAGKTTAGLVFVQGSHGRDVYGRCDFTGEDMQVWLTDGQGQSTLCPGVFSEAAQRVSGDLWGDRQERARRLLDAGRDDADLLSGGKAVELIEAASVAKVSQQVVRTPPPGQAPLPDRARDSVLAAARETASADGLVERAKIVAAVKGKMADGTRDKALTDLVAAGELIRVKNGLYEVPGAAKAHQMDIGEAAQ